jgi:hypothetical protein
MKKMNLKLAFVAAMALMVTTANAQTQSWIACDCRL